MTRWLELWVLQPERLEGLNFVPFCRNRFLGVARKHPSADTSASTRDLLVFSVFHTLFNYFHYEVKFSERSHAILAIDGNKFHETQ
jgi:hypothetical protein